MAAPFPYDGMAGAINDPAEAEARNLHENYKWIARLADEMDAESELDLKRCMQIVLHCRKFRLWYEALAPRASGMDAIEGHFAMKKCRWSSAAACKKDLGDLYADAGALADWIEANVPEYKQGFAIVKVVSDGVLTDEPIKRAKPPELADRLTAFRSRFGAKPT